MSRIIYVVLGVLFYYCRPRKTVVLLTSSMRGGSTLLKALLASAPDVSHLPEVDYRSFLKNRYCLYGWAYLLSKQRIIILKKPQWFEEEWTTWALPRLKIIVLVRDVYEVVSSLQEMLAVPDVRTMMERSERRRRFIEQSQDQLIDYWCDAYEALLGLVASNDVAIVRYEDLVRAPEQKTRELFAFLGSQQTGGVDSYPEPDSGWAWGKDDGGDKIRGRRSIGPSATPQRGDAALMRRIENSSRVARLRAELGYDEDGLVAKSTPAPQLS